MKVLSSEEMQAVDSQTIREYGIPGFSLMECAGMLAVKAIYEQWPHQGGLNVLVLCGTGNNGGDGFAAARHLHWLGNTVTVLLAGEPGKLKGDALINYNLLLKSGITVTSTSGDKENISHEGFFRNTDLIVDGLFGTGLKSDIRDPAASLITAANNSGKRIAALDIPSGIDGNSGHVKGVAVKADLTVTMGLPKIGHLLYPGASYCGELIVAHIGFPPALLEQPSFTRTIPSLQEYRSWLPAREKNAHKGSAGKVLLLAGSKGYTGAAALASESALRAGAGLVYLAVPESLNAIVEEKVTEVITLPYPDLESAREVKKAERLILNAMESCNVLALGPGIGHSEGMQKLAEAIIKRTTLPLVLDADALFPHLLEEHRAKAVVLTPHPGEMARLLGCSTADVLTNPLQCALQASSQFRATVVLKGAHSLIATPQGDLYFNLSGNEGMASAGMGDVLTGTIAGLMAQGAESRSAALLGVFVHGLAGDRAAEKSGTRGLLATDLIARLPEILHLIESGRGELLPAHARVKEISVVKSSQWGA
jgi:ADP-dependent NAD(P)H-hydrate dehydratase / NAD(P)H-hydrate epimerase